MIRIRVELTRIHSNDIYPNFFVFRYIWDIITLLQLWLIEELKENLIIRETLDLDLDPAFQKEFCYTHFLLILKFLYLGVKKIPEKNIVNRDRNDICILQIICNLAWNGSSLLSYRNLCREHNLPATCRIWTYVHRVEISRIILNG